MDPNETLRMLRLAIRQARQSDTDRMVTLAESLETVTELAEALDEWLARGGFLPSEWDHKTRWVKLP
jgi:hypothetical protein